MSIYIYIPMIFLIYQMLVDDPGWICLLMEIWRIFCEEQTAPPPKKHSANPPEEKFDEEQPKCPTDGHMMRIYPLINPQFDLEHNHCVKKWKLICFSPYLAGSMLIYWRVT